MDEVNVVADEHDCPLGAVLRIVNAWGSGALVEVRVRAWADYQLFTLTFPMQQLNLDDRSLAHAELDRKEQLANLGSVLRMRLVPIEFLHLCYEASKCGFQNTKLAFSFTLSPPPLLTPPYAPRIICHEDSWPPVGPPPVALLLRMPVLHSSPLPPPDSSSPPPRPPWPPPPPPQPSPPPVRFGVSSLQPSEDSSSKSQVIFPHPALKRGFDSLISAA